MIERQTMTTTKRTLSEIKTDTVVIERLISEWDHSKPQKLSIKDLTKHTHIYVWWKCSKNHSWSSKIWNRLNLSNCPYCGNQKLLKGYNDFKTRYPEIAKTWSSKNEISCDSFISNVYTRYYWDCALGHSYLTTTKHRVRGQNCSYCSNRQILVGYNDLGTKQPDLVLEWSPNNQKSFTEFTEFSNDRALWICKDCNHEWDTIIANRTRGSGCPKCSKLFSAQEKELYEFIKLHLNKRVKVVENDRKVLSPKELDIYIPSMKLAFEYNGIYWHDKKLWELDIISKTANSREVQKTLLCEQLGITLHHIWSDDWILNKEETQQKILELLV